MATKLTEEDYEAYGLIDTEKMTKQEMIARIKNPKQKIVTCMGTLYEMVKDSEKAASSKTANAIFKKLDKHKVHKVMIRLAGIEKSDNGIWIPQKEYLAFKKRHLSEAESD